MDIDAEELDVINTAAQSIGMISKASLYTSFWVVSSVVSVVFQFIEGDFEEYLCKLQDPQVNYTLSSSSSRSFSAQCISFVFYLTLCHTMINSK